MDGTPGFSLRCYTPLVAGVVPARTDSIVLDPLVTSLSFSSQLPGGCNALKVGLGRWVGRGDEARYQSATLRRPVTLMELGHVELVLGGSVLWAGRVTRLLWDGPDVVGFEAQGYGVSGTSDDLYFSTDNTKVAGAAILRRIFATAAPLITLSGQTSFSDPGVVHTWDEFNEQPPYQVIEQLAKEGGLVGQQFDWTVYPEDQGGKQTAPQMLAFVPRLAPGLAGAPQSEPDYLIPWDTTAQLSSDASNCYGTFRVRYTSVPSGLSKAVEYTEPTFAARFGGLYRRKLIQGGQLTDDGAAAFAQAYAAQYAFPIWAGTVTRELGRGMERYGGSPHPAAYVRAGQWVQIGQRRQPPTQALRSPHEVPPLIIVRAEYDATNQRGTFELGQAAPGEASLIQGLRLFARHQATLTNPITGAKLA